MPYPSVWIRVRAPFLIQLPANVHPVRQQAMAQGLGSTSASPREGCRLPGLAWPRLGSSNMWRVSQGYRDLCVSWSLSFYLYAFQIELIKMNKLKKKLMAIVDSKNKSPGAYTTKDGHRSTSSSKYSQSPKQR